MSALLPGSVLRAGPLSVRIRPGQRRGVLIGGALLVVLVAAALVVGRSTSSAADMLAVFTGDGSPAMTRSILGRRLPRALTATAVGARLAISGAVFVSLSRNPLGSPDILGFTSGAATAAVAAIVLFGGGVLVTAVAALGGGLATALLVYALARRDGASGGTRLVLVGIGVGAIFSAVTSLLMVRADLDTAAAANLWTAGSLAARGWPHVIAQAVAMGALLPALVPLVRQVSLMEMGDETAHGVGIRTEPVRLAAMVLAVALAAVATAAAGPIAFVAFAAPHIAAGLAPVAGIQLWVSAVVGAVLLNAADLLSQHLDFGLRAPVGLITSVLGGLYLLYLLARRI